MIIRAIMETKGPATRNDIVDDIVDDPSSTMVFNVAKIASARASSTISLTKSLRVAGPLFQKINQFVNPVTVNPVTSKR